MFIIEKWCTTFTSKSKNGVKPFRIARKKTTVKSEFAKLNHDQIDEYIMGV